MTTERSTRRKFFESLGPLATGGLFGHAIGKGSEQNRGMSESQVGYVAKELNGVANTPECLTELVKRLSPAARKALLEAINNAGSEKRTE